MSVKIIGQQSVPNMPWQDRPEGVNEPIWRDTNNPIIPRDLIPSANSIFNSTVVPYKGKFAGVFRCDSRARDMQLHAGKSDDGYKWNITNEKIEWITENTETAEVNKWQYGYDPRVVWIEDRYWITWCNGFAGHPTIGVGYTYDFEKFYQVENAFLPFNRNGVLFPRKINGKYVMLSRPSDDGHTPFGDIYLSQSPDMVYWGEHRFVMARSTGWQSTKIGPGPVPIETSAGWLMLYHGVLNSCNGFVYSFGAALLDLEKPWLVLKRSHDYLFNPRAMYELTGDVPNVTFPCANIVDADTGRVAIYYGAADTVTGLAYTTVDNVLEWLDGQ